MKMRNCVITCATFVLTACVQAPVFKSEDHALLRSSYPVVSLNGAKIQPSYKLDIPSGDTKAVIVFRAYRYDYYCTFEWTATPRTAYEVTDQEDKYPLTLYRWVRSNALWASRLDPIDPMDCTRDSHT